MLHLKNENAQQFEHNLSFQDLFAKTNLKGLSLYLLHGWELYNRRSVDM